MKNKRLSAVVIAVIFMFTLGITVICVEDDDIMAVIEALETFDYSKYTQYTEQEWNSLSIDERYSELEYVINSQNGVVIDSAGLRNMLSVDEGFGLYACLVNEYDPGSNIASQVIMEKAGFADFGLGYYNDSHSSGSFADEMNDEFLDYIQKYPYTTESGQATTAYKFDNGYYVTWDPLYITCTNMNYSVDKRNDAGQIISSVTHSGSIYGLQFYLHNETGEIIDIYKHQTCGYTNTPLVICDVCGGTLFNNFTITSDGYYYFDYYSWGYPHLDEYSKVTKSKECPFPWWSLYGTPTEDIVDTVIDAPVAVGEDDDGNKIEFNLTSDGVVYEGDTYNYNDDNTVTINGDTYNITVDYSTVDPDYYDDFVGDTINNYYNYYTTEGTDFDDTDILTALKSLHISLESFGSDTYMQLKRIITQLTALPNQINSSLQTQADRIIKAIEKLNNSIENLDLSTEEQKEKEKLSWLEAIAKVKKKFCVDEIQANILTCYNAMFNATYSDSGGSTVATYSMATVASDPNGNTSVTTNSVTTGFIPSITISFMGESYNLLSSLHSSVWGTYINMAKKLISALLTIAFFIGLYRSLPSIIGGVSGVAVESPQFQEFHNNAEVNYYRSKYDK